ncbi:MAG: diacylglycerol kinase [Flavobacteriales bacterium]|nr:diacylglycerol kinase [Flavobacteriales bacterium]|tara:strand:- start:1209 stop:1709 length:501 start_codon:yes stop_codon:yes gene_type:complete
MRVSLIVAVSANGVIGKDNDLTWHLPRDMKFFKDTTKGHHVIMGRKNFESIPHKFKPLPNRTNVIITRQSDYIAEDCIVVNSVEESIEVAKKNGDEEPFIIGGGQIYKIALENNLIERIYLTRIHHNFEGDTFFPNLAEDWKVITREDCKADEKNKYDYSFLVLEK